MPTIRKLTPEELAELQAQGIDVSQIETEVEVLTPEEQKQLQIQQALGSDTGRGSAVSNTLKAHAGSYVGGGVGAGLGMAAGAALAPETFGLSLLIPALTTALGGAAGGYAGGKLQQAVLPTELEEKLQEKAAASHELYPWTTGVTDLLAGTVAGGGKPSLKGVKYALKGANEALQSGVVSTIPYRQALQNVTVGNAVGAGVNTGLQLAQTGTVDPKEVALNLAGGAFMSEPSALGRKLSMGHWKPLADVRGIEVQDSATPVTLAKSGIKTPEGHNVPENVEEVVARNTKAEKIAAEEAEYSRQWQEKADAIEAEQNRIIAEHQARQQKMADLFAKNDWRNAEIIPDKAVKKAFYNRFKQTAPKGAADLEVAAVEAANKRIKEVPVEAMRQELWQQDFASYDPEGFAAYQAKQKAAQEAQAAKLAAMRQSVEQQNAAIAEAQQRQQRLQDFVKAQKEVAEQQAKEQRIAEKQAAEQAKAEFKARRQEQLRGQLNPESVATQMQRGIAAPEQRPTPFEVNRFRRPFNEVKGEPTTAEEMQHDYDLEQGDKYQAEGEGEQQKADADLLREAAKSDVEVGQLPEDEALLHPQGGEARGINFNPETIGRRLFALSRTATSDTGYHELLHSTLRDMRQSGDPALRRLAQRIESAMGGEEPFVQVAGKEYETAIKRAAGATFSDKVGEWFKNAWATAKTMAGSEDPATLRRNLIALTTRRAGRGQDYLLSTVEGGRGVPSMDEYSDKDDTLEGYRKVTVRRPDGTTYDANFNDKYYTSKGGEKLASLAFKQENGEWTHGMAKSGEKIEDGTQYQGPEEIFTTTTLKELDKERPFGLQISNSGSVEARQLKAKIEKLPKTEQALLKLSGIDSFLENRFVNINDLREALSVSSPKVEVHSYGMEGKVSEAKKEYDRMTHEWADTQLDTKRRSDLRAIRDDAVPEQSAKWLKEKQGWNDEDIAKALQWQKAWQKVQDEPRDTSPRATSAYSTVSALPTDQPMPEWTTSKERKNVQRVDVVIPRESYKTKNGKEYPVLGGGVRMKEPLWQPDNLHENLPNTLGWAMIQYKTGAKGEKIAVIAEAQSRWGQELRDTEKEVSGGYAQNGRLSKEYVDKLRHPLLRDYNRLILKAAIEQARKEGATHIVVSDAETAMMTEGHDMNVRYPADIEAQLLTWRMVEPTKGNVEMAKMLMAEPDATKEYGRDALVLERVANGEGVKVPRKQAEGLEQAGITTRGLDAEKDYGVKLPRPEQEPGMRLNYDTILPKIAEELTGSKGEKVSLGEHKNAYQTGEWQRPNPADRMKRSNLIFRNPDGTPKTDVSGRLYPIKGTSLATRREAGEPYSLTDTHYQAPEKAEPNALLPFLTSRVDKIAKRFNDETGHYVATTLHKFSGYADMMIGRIGNKLVSIGRDLTPEQLDKVYHHLHDIDNTGSSEISLTSNESRVAKAITEALREPRRLQQKEGLLVKQGGKLREAGIKPEGYMFNILDRDVAYEWAEHPDSAKAKAYDEAYIEHQKSKGADDEEAAELLAEYKGALGSQLPGGVEFGALRRAEGNGLPWELVDKNFASASMRYARRAARDLSFFKFLQNDPKMRKALNLEDQEGRLPSATDEPTINRISGSQEVQEAMRSVYSIDTPRSKVLMAAARAVGNAVMGVGTAVRNIANIPAFLGAYVQTGQIPKVFEAISKMNESRARAFENNAVRTSFKDFDAAGYVQQDPNPLVNLFNKFTDYARKYQGRDFSDKFEGEFYYSLGELLAVDNIAKAKTGNAESRRFVKRFGDIVEGGSERLLSGEVTQDDISRIAKRFVDGARGTYSEEGLPSWAIEGEIAPFTALSRFSIEKANTIYKDVVVPAREGNYAPLLRYTLASLGVGLGIEELNELLSGKRGPDPKLNEVLAAGDAEDLTAKAVGLLQLASFAGIVADGAKAALQISNGKSRFSSPLSFPLYTLVTDTIAGNLGDAVDAIHQGENPFDVMGELAINVASQSVQTLRYVDNNLLRPEDTARREKFRDVEVFKELEGNSTPETSGGANPYLGINSRKFKRATNIDEALQLLPGLINKAFEKAGGDIEKLRNELRKLKNVSYQTMPSLENAPLGFLRYLNYLKITQGEQAMSERLRDYLEQNAINDVKAQMVP